MVGIFWRLSGRSKPTPDAGAGVTLTSSSSSSASGRVISQVQLQHHNHNQKEKEEDEDEEESELKLEFKGSCSSSAAASSPAWALEFKAVQHPVEPDEKDQPVRCPSSEPSILHDGRIWKERMEASFRRRTELIHDSGAQSQIIERPQQILSNDNLIAPSFSCPEHSMAKLLDECTPHAKS